MNGLLIIDKPAGITSHDVVSRVRRTLKTRRVGHTGTLDPFATGVMVVLVGQATRLAQFLDKDVKEYETTVRFGFETDTGDRTGERRDTGTQGRGDEVTLEQVAEALVHFRGEIEQMPPMYSAKKIDGKKLYEHARKGETVARKAIAVTISELEVIETEKIRNPRSAIRIRVVCSAGTYIRTLAEDIGRKIGVGAHLAELRRTRAGRFTIDMAHTFEQLDALDEPYSVLISMNEAVSHLQAISLDDGRANKTKNGLSTRVGETNFGDGEAIQMVGGDGQLVAIGFYNEKDRAIQPKVVLV